MPATFREVLLDPYYSPFAQGGPEFASRIFGAPDSGIETISIGRDVARWRYTIDYNLLNPDRKALLYRHFLIMRGMAYGFRFLAPDDNLLELELVATTTGGLLTYSLIKTYSVYSELTDQYFTYVRRITKPAIRSMTFFLGDQIIEVNPPETLYGGTLYGESEYMGADGATATVTLDYTTGTLTFGADPGGGLELRASGQFHIPVRFSNDYFSVRHDVTVNEWQGIELTEMLPATLGIT